MTHLLVDGNNLAMRSIHAMARSGLSADGVLTGPLLVFVNSLSRFVREESPSRVVVCWDRGPSAMRVALYPAYKAHRQQVDPEADEHKHSAFSLMKEFLALSNICQVEREGYEADDLIAHYVAKTKPGVVIASSDKDFLMLLCEGVEQIRLSSGGAETDRWTMTRVWDEYGCNPWHLRLAMALAGDTSDGIPGVPRFGMKTAIKTLRKHEWDLDAIDHPAVVEHRDQVEVALRLVDLLSPIDGLSLSPLPPFEPTWPGSALWEPLLSFLVRYQLDSVKARLYEGALWGMKKSEEKHG